MLCIIPKMTYIRKFLWNKFSSACGLLTLILSYTQNYHMDVFMLSKKLLAPILAAICLPALAAEYYIVVPVPNRIVSPSISVMLNAYTLMPTGIVGAAYPSFDFKPLLSVSGDPNYTVNNAVFSATGLPGGLSLSQSGVLSGTPTVAGSSTFAVSANYRGVVAQRNYTLGVSNQRTCLDIKNATPSASDGLYTVYPDGTNALQVYCDMTRDGGGWTLIVRAIAGSNAHANSSEVGTLTSPSQTTVAKLSDTLINSMPKTAYRALNNAKTSAIFFDTSDSFAATRPVSNKASKSITSPVWEGPFYDSSHRGFNTHQGGAGHFARNDSSGMVYTGGIGDSCRLGVNFMGGPDWCGVGDSATIWLR